MNLFGTLIAEYLKLRIKKIRHFASHPLEVQNELLLDLLQSATRTEIGRKYGFDQILDPEEFRQSVPVQTYEQYHPLIQRVIKGEPNVIWPGEIPWFAMSSGTTSDKSKYIPVTKESLETSHLRGPRDLMCLYAYNNPGTRVFNGKSLVMGGSTKPQQADSNATYGDVSALMMINQPLLASYLRTPGLSTALLDDWEEKIERIAGETMSQNITSLAGVPSWTLVLIRRILEMAGTDNLLDVWPNLEVYIHGGVSFQPYRKTFEELIPDPEFRYYQTYNASEGFFAYQDENGADDMLLALKNGIYYEFIPQGQFESDDPVTIGLDAVEAGKNYAMVITTNAGLWRYKLGDTVQFTSTFPFRIKVSGRTKHFINAFGEEVIVDNADQAIADAARRTGCNVVDYSVAPVYFEGNEKACHQWLVEFGEAPQDTADFMVCLDMALKKVNADYEAKRSKDMALKMPELVIARKGLFYRWLKQKNKLGGQNKVPRLCNDRRYMDDLLALNRD